MWKFIARSISRFVPKKNLKELAKGRRDFSDDETSSDTSEDEGLECPICWESFNIVENVPYILFCGHTLCKNCVMCLQGASLKFSSQRIKIPFLISCPWCNSLTFRLVCRDNLRFPRKNYFLLWMVESRNGDRVKSSSPSRICQDHHHHRQVWSPWCSFVFGNYYMNDTNMSTDRSSSTLTHNNGRLGSERSRTLFRKSLDFFIRMAAKLPLVILLVIVLSALPVIACILLLYLLITILFAVPSLLVLYFAYRALYWLGRELRT